MEEKMVVQGPSWLREAALKLLPTLDLNTATQSSISQQLQAQLGCDLTIHKDFLGEIIDEFLLSWEEGKEVVPSTQDAEPTAVVPPAAKRAKDDASEAAVTRAPAPATASASTSVHLSDFRRVTVDTFKGQVLVNVREMYEKEGDPELKPGSKGLAMNTNQFRKLVAHADKVDAALLTAGPEVVAVELTDTRLVTVKDFHGPGVDFRDFFMKGDALAPTKKGIFLPAAQWVKLRAALPSLLLAVDRMDPEATPPQEPDDSAPSSTTTPLPPPAAAADPSTPGPSTAAQETGYLALDDTRRVTVAISTVTKRPSVDVREYYMTPGGLKPGTKGCFLNDLQWQSLVQHAPAVHAAVLQSGQMQVKLGNTLKKVTVDKYQGITLVALREYYIGKSSEAPELPGKKGISLNVAQWTILYENLPKLDTQFKALSS